MRRRPSQLVILVWFFLTLGQSPPPKESQKDQDAELESQRRALLVAISEYAPESGWERLHAENDLALMRSVLALHRFEPQDRLELTNRDATLAGISRAFQTHLLRPAEAGGLALFYFSGHGQQLTDGSDADEPDGYDEALVPYDAPLRRIRGYRGERHLRDDTLSQWLWKLRRKLGEAGQVIVILDSCFSGTGTRGHAARRGGPPLGPPREGSFSGRIDEGGGLELRISSLRRRNLAALVVFSASPHDLPTNETPGTKPTGALTQAFSQALHSATYGMSYRDVFGQVKKLMQQWTPNPPQAEGDLDREVFGGSLTPRVPFLKVSEVLPDQRTLVIRPGSLSGLKRGAEVEIHRDGTEAPAESSRLTSGLVDESAPLYAAVPLQDPVTEEIRSGRVFIQRYSFGNFRLFIELVGVPDPLANAVRIALSRSGAVRIVKSQGELRVLGELDSGEKVVSIVRTDTGETILGPVATNSPLLPRHIADRLVDFARNRYLRRLNLPEQDFGVDFEVIPVRPTDCEDPANPTFKTCEIDEVDPKPFISRGKQLRLPLGTYFMLKLRVENIEPYIAILDLMPDGQIELLWPVPGTNDQTRLAPGESRFLPELYQITEPQGLDVFLMVASTQFIDFEPFRSASPRSQRKPPRLPTLGPFAPLFADLSSGQRTTATFDPGKIATASVTVQVVERLPAIWIP